MENNGIQVWSNLPLETLGDYLELGFVHGSNNIAEQTDFPHEDAESIYTIGRDYGKYFQTIDNPLAKYAQFGKRDYAADRQDGHLYRGDIRLAYTHGYLYAGALANSKRTIVYSL